MSKVKATARLLVFVCAVLTLCAEATDYYWTATVADSSIANSGGKSGNGGAVTNWSVKVGDGYEVATQLPQGGDVIIFDNRLYTKAFAPMTVFNNANKDTGLGGMIFTGTGYVKNSNWAIVWGEAKLYVSGAGGILSNDVANTTGPMVWADIEIVGPGTGAIFSSVAGGTWSQVRSVRGSAPLIVNGPGLVRLIEYNNDNNPNAPHDPGTSTHCKNYSLRVPAIVLRGEADIQCWWKLTNTVVRFDTDAAKLTVGYQKADAGYHDLYLGNGSSIAETTANLTGRHTINASTAGILHIKNTPGVTVQTFTGKMTGVASLDFDPTPTGYSFVFSGATSDTTGALIVSNGTVRLSNGATFTQLSGVTVAAGGMLKVDNGSGAGFRGGVLTLASGGTIDVGTGVSLAFSSGTLGGSALAEKIYTKDNAAWLTGDGTVVVGSDVWPADKTDIWNRDDYPAALPTGETWWRGMSFSGADLNLTAAEGAVAYLGPSGVICAGVGAGVNNGHTYKSYWPMRIVGNQTWTLGADRIHQYGPMTTFATGEIRVDSEAGGGLSLWTSNPDLSHSFAVSNGVVNVVANNALGRGTTYFDGTKVTLNLFGVTLDNPIVCTVNNATPSQRNQYLKGLANKTNVFNGCYSMAYDGHAALKGEAGTHYIFRGGITKPRGYLYVQSDMTVELTPMAMNVGALQLYDGATLTLAVANNDVGSNNLQMGAGQRLRTTVPYALNGIKTFLNMNIGNSGMTTFDLCGNDQSVTYVKGGPYSVVTSGVHAVLHTTTDSDYADHNGRYTWSQTAYHGGVPTNYVNFAGGVSLQVDGKGYLRLAGYSSTTGMLVVAGGGLVEMAASQVYPPDGKTYKGAWTNASAVVVRNGTLDVQHSQAFGPETVVKFEGTNGTIQLDAGVVLKVAGLEIDGVPMSGGTYGGPLSRAQRKPTVVAGGETGYRFSGTGMLLVPGGGVTIIFR